jgi:CubicO group peptidase (beta-lactamase class C family)
MSVEQAVDGFVAAGFEPVADAFAVNLAERGELGAAFAAMRDGELVVDLWGGVADREQGRAWERDTLQLVFSGTKGLVAICLLLLIDRERLELDARVAEHWPEFAAAGKGAVTVREVVSHTARMPGLTTPLTLDDLVDDRRMAELLAAQAQLEDPRAIDTYHALTYGWLCGELVRRIDGRSVGRFFAEELAEPLGLDLHIGLPAEREERVSRLELADTWGACPVFDPAAVARDELMRAVWGNPAIWTPDVFAWNDPRMHAAEIPGAGAIGTARAIATLYGSLEQLVSPGTLRLGRTQLVRREEPLTGELQSFGIGFELQTEQRLMGPPTEAFGHGGAGGSLHGAWPLHGVGFSYAMNLMRDDQLHGDVRSQALLTALHDCVVAIGA